MTTEFFQKYQHKIKTIPELLELLGVFPRQNKIIVCHGVFDVVHPGHVRHLAYAKTKADTLVVSITADRHIKKGTYRPHIPENLRALNLAAFEMVDFVVIDQEPTALNSLRALRPDFFAKGFEYTSSGLPPATQAEQEVMDSYGGQLIFTPGDVVYSSSKFLNLALPQVQIEKLLLLMDQNKLSFDILRDTVNKLANFHVHIVGDTIVDTYTRTTLIGGQTKTPTFSVQFQDQKHYIGGAGIVAQHLRAAGAEVTLSTVLGDDSLKDFVIRDLENSGVHAVPVIDPSRPTTNKNAFIAGGYRLLKVDTLDNRPIADSVLRPLIISLQISKAEAVVFSDFRHGIFNRMSVPSILQNIPRGVFRVADSQVASRWGNITEFKDFDLITPNEREVRFALADQDSNVSRLCNMLLKSSRYHNLILKLGDKGIYCVRKDQSLKDANFWVDSFAGRVVDPVGAGDALLAYSTLAMLATGSLAMAGILGSMAAACECELDGNIPIQSQDVIDKITFVESLAGYRTGAEK